MRFAFERMSDHRWIRRGDGMFLPSHARDTHQASLAWLRGELSRPFDGTTIVVTHHAPSGKSGDPRHDDSLSPAFASALETVVREHQPPLWIHGHTHHNIDYTIGSTRILSNQRGYPNQPCNGFDPSLVVEL